MGLKKKITLPNGISLNYHRITGLDIATNAHNAIRISSYTTQAQRAKEKKAIEEAQKLGYFQEPLDVLVQGNVVMAPYDQTMTIQSAYEWLKENSGYEGATDILEEGQPQTPEEMAPEPEPEQEEEPVEEGGE